MKRRKKKRQAGRGGDFTTRDGAEIPFLLTIPQRRVQEGSTGGKSGKGQGPKGDVDSIPSLLTSTLQGTLVRPVRGLSETARGSLLHRERLFLLSTKQVGLSSGLQVWKGLGRRKNLSFFVHFLRRPSDDHGGAMMRSCARRTAPLSYALHVGRLQGRRRLHWPAPRRASTLTSREGRIAWSLRHSAEPGLG